MALHGDTAIGRSEDYAAEVERLVTPTLEAMGYDLVRLQLAGKRGLTLQIMAERKDRREMTVDDCAEISRTVSAVLDVEDPIPGNYTLEVSSPGLERPLVRKDDFVRFAGMEAKVESTQMIDGRKRFRGRIEGVRGDDVVISGDWGEAAVPLAAIQRAKLVLTDDVIAAELEKRGR